MAEDYYYEGEGYAQQISPVRSMLDASDHIFRVLDREEKKIPSVELNKDFFGAREWNFPLMEDRLERDYASFTFIQQYDGCVLYNNDMTRYSLLHFVLLYQERDSVAVRVYDRVVTLRRAMDEETPAMTPLQRAYVARQFMKPCQGYRPKVTQLITRQLYWQRNAGEMLLYTPPEGANFFGSEVIEKAGIVFHMVEGSSQQMYEYPELARDWLMYKKQSGSLDFRDPDMYEKRMDDYMERVGPIHREQLAKIAAVIPEDVAVYAPADAAGVMKSVLPRAFCSDRVGKGAIACEDISTTIARVGPTDVLVLAYCHVFLTDEDKRAIASKECAVIVLDAYPAVLPWPCPRPLGPFTVGYRWGYDDPGIMRGESTEITPDPAFYHNVQDLPSPIFFEDWGGVGAWMTLHRAEVPSAGPPWINAFLEAKGKTPSTGPFASRVVHKLDNLRFDGEARYFTPIGKYVRETSWFNPLKRTAYEVREIYRVTEDWRSALEANGVMVYEVGDALYFWVSTPRDIAMKIRRSGIKAFKKVTFALSRAFKWDIVGDSIMVHRGGHRYKIDRGIESSALIVKLRLPYDTGFLRSYLPNRPIPPAFRSATVSKVLWDAYVTT